MSRPQQIALWVGLVLLLSSISALATVSLSGTRLIFDGRFREASLHVINRSKHPVLVQAWLAEPANVDGDPDAAGSDLPFVLTPHLSHLEQGARRTLRVLYQGQGMAQDVESLLHFYVLEIPRRVQGSNLLSIAIRQRINLFYRPPGLTDNPADTPYRLRWTLAKNGAEQASLTVSNPTSYHAALQDVQLGGLAVSEYLLLAPGASHVMPAPVISGSAGLSFKALNDYGGVRAFCAPGNGDGIYNTQYRQKDC